MLTRDDGGRQAAGGVGVERLVRRHIEPALLDFR
jgi:hypothetical protein